MHRTVVVTSGETDELRDTVGPHQVVIDTTPQSAAALRQGIAAVTTGGRMVLCGLKGRGVRLDVDVDELVHRRLTVVAPPSKTPAAFAKAVEALNSGRLPLDAMPTASYPLARTLEAIGTLASTDPRRPFHVRVDPQS